MAFLFRYLTSSQPFYIAVDFESRFIKTAVFEKSTAGIAPAHIVKTVTPLAQAGKKRPLADTIREILDSLIKEKRTKPEKVIVGISPHIGDISLQEWTVDKLRARESLTSARLQEYFQQLFNKNRDPHYAFLAYPLAIDANGYAVTIQTLSSRDISHIKELTFHTIILKFSEEMGTFFRDLTNAFSGISLEIIPSQAACTEALTALFNNQNALFVDVGNSMTTLMLVRHGLLVQLTAFPLGAERFHHHIIKMRGGKFAEAKDLARQYSQGLMSKEEQADLSHVFSKEISLWKDAFAKSLEVFYPFGPLPRDLLLYGSGSYMPEVRSSFWGHDMLKNFSSFDSFDVHIIQAPQIFKNNVSQAVLNGPEDVRLASLVHYSLYHTPLF